MSSEHVFPFSPSTPASTGVEMEWIIIDRQSAAQCPLAPDILPHVEHTARIKPELFTSTVEINTDIHHSTAACIRQLQALTMDVRRMLHPLHGDILASGTHPFSHWRQQTATDDPRYARLLERLQWMARRFNIFGIHVHIGMPDGDTCIRVMNQLLPVMPAFLAISANSPFWHGEDTGLSASRIKVFEGLSQGGMPFYFRDWEDFEHCAARLLATGSIDSVRDIWWEMRPHPDFGTLEIRVGDMPFSLDDTAAYIAYVRAETMAAMQTPQDRPRVHPSLIRENRWRACRYGIQMEIIDPQTETARPLLQWLQQRLTLLHERGAAAEDVAIVRRQIEQWAQHGDGATRQRQLHLSHRTFPDMVHAMRCSDGWSPSA